MDKLWERIYSKSMDTILKSQGAKNVWDLFKDCNDLLEAITDAREIEEDNIIPFFPNGTCEDSSLMKQLAEYEPDFPMKSCPHYGGVTIGIVTLKGPGEVKVVHDMNDLFSYSYTQRGVQLDYGRMYRAEMILYLSGVADILNSPKALKERKLFLKDEQAKTTGNET
jgi:hypothetical protein